MRSCIFPKHHTSVAASLMCMPSLEPCTHGVQMEELAPKAIMVLSIIELSYARFDSRPRVNVSLSKGLDEMPPLHLLEVCMNAKDAMLTASPPPQAN